MCLQHIEDMGAQALGCLLGLGYHLSDEVISVGLDERIGHVLCCEHPWLGSTHPVPEVLGLDLGVSE